MARLIDADALLNALGLDHMTEADGYKMDLMRSDIRDAINDAPTVDAVEIVKEEKKMLNFDKYREEILSGDLDELSCKIAVTRCHTELCNGNHCDVCCENSIKWLCQEYEPPLLKNGDDLKPGDWIMVRDEIGHAWKKRCFMCYKNGYFITTEGECSIGATGRYEAWQQARLPMEGE